MENNWKEQYDLQIGDEIESSKDRVVKDFISQEIIEPLIADIPDITDFPQKADYSNESEWMTANNFATANESFSRRVKQHLRNKWL